MSTTLFLGEYQLRNLLKNQVPFLYFDFRKPASRAKDGASHPLFSGAIPTTLDAFASVAAQQALSKDYPIVLICENGDSSVTAAGELEKLGYTNVFVLRGGTESLDLTKK